MIPGVVTRCTWESERFLISVPLFWRPVLSNLCYQIFQITKDCNSRDLLPRTLIDETDRISKKIQSQRFRVAVVGEFSRGKSTLINALLGEQIQPVRAIPCSGTLTVLKHGVRKRVVCRYRDGREEEISIAHYQEKAAISTNAALGNFIDELAISEIDELIFEHPALDLCGSGVEIIDTPGLNEHPCRTTITQKLLMNADAIIFLTHAQQSFNEGERNLLQELKTQLNDGKVDEAAENIFIVVNFWDLVSTDIDCQQIQQRVKNILQGPNKMIRGENRIHFISSKAALDAILNKTEDRYLKSFRHFTESLESFLTSERGYLEIQRSALRLARLIQSSINELHQAERFLDGQLNLSDEEKNKFWNIWEKSAPRISGYSV
jgi:GTPase SAR1 family protein